ncbi:MAG TPA: AsmA family protein, partial [Wenzhouxiangella sp.]|nr:AsmA family protein [Wenzhouxiangella sp.]
MRRTIILAAALAIMLLGFWGTMVIYFDEARLKGLVSGQLSEQFGRRVEIVGALRFSFFPRLHVEAADVIIAGPGDDDERAMLRAQRVRMSLQLLPLLRGEFAPGQMQLSDAVVNLARWRDDARAADSLSAIRSAAQYLSGRSLQLRNISLLLPGDSGRLA